MVLSHYGEILRSGEVGGERRIVLVDVDVPFDLFEIQIKCATSNGSSLVKIFYFLKYEAMSIFAHVFSHEYLTVMLYLFVLYKVDRICICVI